MGPRDRPGVGEADRLTIGRLLARGRRRLLGAAEGPSAREVYLLLGHLLGWDEARLRAREETEVPIEVAAAFDALVERRRMGEPAAYLVGRREFFGRPFLVDERALIPRPESEHLVEAALDLPFRTPPRFLDVGTGTGCLAVTLALELAGSLGVAIDASPGALALAAANVRALGADRVLLAGGDLVDAIDLSRIDLVVANLPYVAGPEAPGLAPGVLAFEPAAALFAGDGGLALIRRLLTGLAALRPGTPVLLEIGHDQAEAVAAAAEVSGLDVVEVRRDYAALPRVVILRSRGSRHG